MGEASTTIVTAGGAKSRSTSPHHLRHGRHSRRLVRHSSDVDAAADAGGAPAVPTTGEDVGLLRSVPERDTMKAIASAARRSGPR